MARAPSKNKNIKTQIETQVIDENGEEVFSTGTAKISSKKIN